jgi:hypothetical protein
MDVKMAFGKKCVVSNYPTHLHYTFVIRRLIEL